MGPDERTSSKAFRACDWRYAAKRLRRNILTSLRCVQVVATQTCRFSQGIFLLGYGFNTLAAGANTRFHSTTCLQQLPLYLKLKLAIFPNTIFRPIFVSAVSLIDYIVTTESPSRGTPRSPLSKALDAISCVPFLQLPSKTFEVLESALFIEGTPAGTFGQPDINLILQKSNLSTFGRGEKTVTDPAYRHGREIPAAFGKFPGLENDWMFNRTLSRSRTHRGNDVSGKRDYKSCQMYTISDT
jgi:hypothetical protein